VTNAFQKQPQFLRLDLDLHAIGRDGERNEIVSRVLAEGDKPLPKLLAVQEDASEFGWRARAEVAGDRLVGFRLATQEKPISRNDIAL
jgi:hypothetical protein